MREHRLAPGLRPLRFASLRFTSPRFFLIPQNDQLPQNPDRSFSLPAIVAAAAGYLGLILTLIFAAKGASLTNAEDALQDAQHPHSGGDKKFFWGSIAAFAVAVGTGVMFGCTSKTVPVLQDLVFGRTRSRWLGFVSLLSPAVCFPPSSAAGACAAKLFVRTPR